MTYLHVGSRVPVLFMRINVAKEDGYLCRILAVEVRRVKCVFPRNKVQKEICSFVCKRLQPSHLVDDGYPDQTTVPSHIPEKLEQIVC